MLKKISPTRQPGKNDSNDLLDESAVTESPDVIVAETHDERSYLQCAKNTAAACFELRALNLAC